MKCLTLIDGICEPWFLHKTQFNVSFMDNKVYIIMLPVKIHSKRVLKKDMCHLKQIQTKMINKL